MLEHKPKYVRLQLSECGECKSGQWYEAVKPKPGCKCKNIHTSKMEENNSQVDNILFGALKIPLYVFDIIVRIINAFTFKKL